MHNHKILEPNTAFFTVLQDLLNNLKKPNFECNSFLFISKLSVSNIIKYKLCLDKNLFYVLCYVLTFVFRIIIRIVLIFYHNFKLVDDDKELVYESYRNINIDHIFVSHFIKQEPDLNNDNYFGSLPDALKQKNQIVKTIYIQHNFDKIKYKNIHLINSKLSVKELFKLLVEQFIDSYYVCLNYFGNGAKDFLMHLCAIEHQFSRSTIYNIGISSKITQLCTSLQVKNLHLTFEGNPIELKISINLLHTKIKLNLHQFSPVTQGHIGLIRFIRNPQIDRLTIFTTGDQIKKYLDSISIKPHKIITLGTFKVKDFSALKNLPDRDGVILLADGTSEQALMFTLLAKKLGKSFPNTKFILRLHPDSIIKNKIIKVVKSSKMANVLVSNQPLIQDFKECRFAIFNTSASGIQGMHAGVFPIHISEFETNSEIMNPFFWVNSKFFRASNYFNIEAKLKSLLETSDHKYDVNLTAVANGIFKFFDYRTLEFFENYK